MAHATNASTGRTIESREVDISADRLTLSGSLDVPNGATGIVLFAHGSGSGRFSPRNRYVASSLQHHGLATLLIDLLTADEEHTDNRTGHLRFDIGLLADRLLMAIDWIPRHAPLTSPRIGLFGASTGAGAALVAAAAQPAAVRAVVSRGGRPDLAGNALPLVQAPTLLIVGGDDAQVIELNRAAMRRMTGHTEIEIVAGASHLFEEPGTLEQVARLAADWFAQYLR